MLLELLGEALAVHQLPQWATTLGVAYLVVQERRRARRQTRLEREVKVLVDGHAGDAAAHRRIPEVLLEEPHARHH